MIRAYLHSGMGLGNQLWTIYSTRGIANLIDQPFEILNSSKFKLNGHVYPIFSSTGSAFSEHIEEQAEEKLFRERQILDSRYRLDISGFDGRVMELVPNTRISGYFQSLKYLPDRKTIRDEIGVRGWDFDGCTINVRGGEYRGLKNILLGRSYYQEAVDFLRTAHGVDRFRIVTDDRDYARSILPGYEIISSGGVKRVPFLPYIHPSNKKIYRDFSSIQRSRYQILSNSTFSWWAAFSSSADAVLAPRYWMGYHSDEIWSPAEIVVPGWLWLDKKGQVLDSIEC